MSFRTGIINPVGVDAHRFLKAASAYRSHAGEVLVFRHENHSLPNGEGTCRLRRPSPAAGSSFLVILWRKGGMCESFLFSLSSCFHHKAVKIRAYTGYGFGKKRKRVTNGSLLVIIKKDTKQPTAPAQPPEKGKDGFSWPKQKGISIPG